MTYPGKEVHAEIRALDITEDDLAVMTDIRAPIIRAWMNGDLDPCDSTVRTVLRALQSAQSLRRRHGFVPLDDNTIRWVKEQLAAVGALAT